MSISRFFFSARVSCGVLVLSATAPAFGRGETQVWSNSFDEALLGTSIAILGDVNGDTIADFAVSAPDSSGVPCRAGRVFVVDGVSGATIRTLYGTDATNSFGARVAAAGDVNGDSIPDLLTSAPIQPFSGTKPSRVRIHSGVDGTVLRDFVPVEEFSPFGIAIAGGHDIDADLVPDVFIVTTQYSNSGGIQLPSVEAFSGATGLRIYELPNPISGAFAFELEFVGDLDGDGVSDLAIGSYDSDTNGVNSGHVRVVSAATGVTLFDITGADSFDWFGFSLSALGDINGDGKPDFAAGAANDEIGAPSAGSVSVVSGATGARLWTTAGTYASQRLGYSVTRLADLNGNGIPEVVCGSFGWPTEFQGALDVRDGQTGALIYGLAATAGMPLGMRLVGSPDTDGDGKGEILNGSPWASETLTGRLSRINPSATAPPIALDIEGSIAHYGTATADSSGNLPHLEASGSTAPAGALNISIQNAIGGQLCAVLLGTVELGTKISPNGAALLTQPNLILIAPLSGSGAGNGSLSIPAIIPATPLPPHIHVQALCGDPGSPLGFTPTRAARLKF